MRFHQRGQKSVLYAVCGPPVLAPGCKRIFLHTLFVYQSLPAEALLLKEDTRIFFVRLRVGDHYFFDPLIFVLCSTTKATVLTHSHPTALRRSKEKGEKLTSHRWSLTVC